MKKLYRILPLILVLILLLSACAEKKAPPENTAGNNTPVSPSETSVAETPAPEASPPEILPSPPRVEDGVLIPSPGMELDEFDLSEKYERWYPETTLEIIPRDDYGELFPFVGRWSLGYMMMYSSSYGLCTADGKIVCDAVFTDVKRFEHEGRAVYILLRPSENSETRGEYYLAASDGSFAFLYEQALNGYEGTFTVQKNGRWGSVDYSGKELVPFIYAHPVFFGEGLAAVTEDFEVGYKYIDKENNTVIDNMPPIPFKKVDQRNVVGLNDAYSSLLHDLSFLHGRALYYEGDSYGYIDKTGTVIALYYEEEGWFRGERFGTAYTVVKNGLQYAIIDTDANVILPFEDSYIQILKTGGEIIFSRYNGFNNTTTLYDTAGNEIMQDREPGSYYHDTGWGMIFVQRENWNFNAILKGTEEIPIPECHYYCVINSDYTVLQRLENQDGDALIDSDGNIISKFSYGGKNYRFIEDYRSHFPRSYVTYGNDYRYMGIMTLDGEFVTEPRFESIQEFGGYYAVYGNGVGGLLDENGEWIVRLSILDDLD